MSKYDPEKRQLQITNKYICNALSKYTRYLNGIAESFPTYQEHAKNCIEGAIGLLSYMGLEPVIDDDGSVKRIRKCVKSSVLRIK